MGCGSLEGKYLDGHVNNEENIVCEICNVCFNTRERAPLVICPSNHSACKECVEAMAGKEHTRCPFCRCDLTLAGLRQNDRLMGKLSAYENEEKKLARKTPSSLSREELLDWTLEEAKKHGYSEVVRMILSRLKRPLEGVK